MLEKRRRRLRNLSISSLAPNILTVLALCAGLTAIRFSLQGRYELAVAAVLLAALLDGLDGRLARLLKGASKFGAELDSLSDFVSFGVAPALVVFLWTLQGWPRIGWIMALAFAVCCALRLARFNTASDDHERPAWSANFFTGLAAPAAAVTALLPMILSFQDAPAILRSPYLNGVWLAAVGLFMVSQVPTFSFKRIRVRRDFIVLTLILVGLGAAVLVSYPWFTVALLTIAYLATVPFAIHRHSKLAKSFAGAAPEIDVPLGEDDDDDADSAEGPTVVH